MAAGYAARLISCDHMPGRIWNRRIFDTVKDLLDAQHSHFSTCKEGFDSWPCVGADAGMKQKHKDFCKKSMQAIEYMTAFGHLQTTKRGISK